MSGTNGSHRPAETNDRHSEQDTHPLDERERRAHVDALIAEARALRRFDLDRLDELANEALSLAREPCPGGGEYSLGAAGALSLIAYRNAALGESKEALTCAQRAIGMLDSLEPCQLLGDLYDSMAWAHFSMGSFVDALSQLMNSLEIAEAIGDKTLMANALDTMGNVHTVSGHPEAGLDLHLRAIELHRETGDRFNESIALNNAAYTYLALDRNAEALECALLALEYARQSGRLRTVTSVLGTVADAYLAMGDLDEAETHARRALETSREQGLLRDETDCLLTLGDVAMHRGAYDEAAEMTSRALTLAERQGRSVEVASAHERLANIEEQRGNLGAALRHSRDFHMHEYRRISAETQAQLASLRVEYQVETAKKDAEIQRLRNLALERQVEEQRIAQARLEAQASLDPLTGLFNRRHLPVLAEELSRALLAGVPSSVVLCDIDRFKRINDGYGHLIGDRTLTLFARLLRDHGHEGDTSLRYGGDEFLIVLIGANGQIARSRAERLRKAIAKARVPSGDDQVMVTASFGVVAALPSSPVPLHDLIGEADRALYTAKNSGRDCVVGCEL